MPTMKSQVWAVVLAGGEGARLRGLVRTLYGDERPKQYVPLLGERTLLGDTLERVALQIPATRTVVVTTRSHARYFDDRSDRGESILVQPANRGTAAGILLPIHWIGRRDPEAVVAVFPSDHFVSDGPRFMAQVARVAAWVRRSPRRIVLLGAHPSSAEEEYGWIERGQSLGGSDDQIAEVSRFWEKPSPEQAQACLHSGCLWNTFVLVGTVGTFCRTARITVPALEERLSGAERFFGTEFEAGALHQAYALMRTASFSRAVLQQSVSALAVAALEAGVTWSDLGSPRRVLDVLHGRGGWPLEPRARAGGPRGL
jgi:mannose-1-phosphate guanylyltransferase